MGTKHTPGPWHILCGEYEAGEFKSILIAREDTEGTDEDVWGKVARALVSRNGSAATEANARLIAAAPAMHLLLLLVSLNLARFEGFDFCFDGLRYSHHGDWDVLLKIIGWDKAAAAVAKATAEPVTT